MRVSIEWVCRTARGVARSSSNGVLTRASTCRADNCIWDLVMSGTRNPFSSTTMAWAAWDCAYLICRINREVGMCSFNLDVVRGLSCVRYECLGIVCCDGDRYEMVERVCLSSVVIPWYQS